MPPVLEGVKVIDIGNMLAAPGTAAYLADQGADVIKVESPMGDEARRLVTQAGDAGDSPPFLAVNRSKRGIVVDIRRPEGREVLFDLARDADVLIQNLRPAVTERLGLGYEVFERLNPRIIYVELSAYGKEGPYASKIAYDMLVQAVTGMMHRSLPDGTPLGTGIMTSDTSAPMLLSYGVALALYNRERTGRGQKVETSLMHAAIALQAVELVEPEARRGKGRPAWNQAVFQPYRCGDGAWLMLCLVTDAEWARFCKTADLEHLAADLRYAESAGRAEHSVELYAVLEAVFESRPRSEWVPLLDAADIPYAPIVKREEVFASEQVEANGMMTDVSHPEAGRTRLLAPPTRLSKNPPRPTTPAPLHGQHTDEVLAEHGYDAAKIARLREAKIIL